MKNNIRLKKFLIVYLIFSFIFILSFYFINKYEYKIYNRIYYNKISSIIGLIEDKYPDILEKDIIEILNNDSESNILNKYSYNSNILPNNRYIIYNIIFLSISFIFILLYFLKFNNKKDKDIKMITKYIEQINKKNYKLELDDMSEEELSILKNEIYKTTITLKEAAENSNLEKLELKKSLSDISHQLKTPLTSINIMLDNLIDDINMDKSVREDFLKDIKRELNNINFLVQTILKLSKLDTNTIEFNNKKVKLDNIVKESIKNVSMLSDLMDINIDVTYNNEAIINCDFKWQVEAISNILKNSIEHSFKDSNVKVLMEDNKVYSSIIITNKGKEIDKNDLKHIFDRFYKGKNSLPDSIGIGLSLSKALIEKNNGKIYVDSNNNETIFTIKYFK